jgi:hypothetical protein
MIAPILPGAEKLAGMLAGKVDYVIVDRMNYAYANKIYLKHGWRDKNTDKYFDSVGRQIAEDCARLGIACRSAYSEQNVVRSKRINHAAGGRGLFTRKNLVEKEGHLLPGAAVRIGVVGQGVHPELAGIGVGEAVARVAVDDQLPVD